MRGRVDSTWQWLDNGKAQGLVKKGKEEKMGMMRTYEKQEDAQMTELLNGERGKKDKTVFQKDETREWKGDGKA